MGRRVARLFSMGWVMEGSSSGVSGTWVGIGSGGMG